MNTTPDSQSEQLTVRIPETDCILDAGTFKLSTDDNGDRYATIAPPEEPMFLQVVNYLETKPIPKTGSTQTANQARAAVGVCLRWGSYFALLADHDRPFAENIDDKEVSQISDDEMARINIEISAGLQWWFNLQVEDGKRYWDLAERAVKYLPLGPKSIERLPDGPVLRSCGHSSMASAIDSYDVGLHANKRLEELKTDAQKRARAVSNTITNVAWRSGPIENVHAGTSKGYALDRRRISLRDERAIIRKAQGGIYDGLQAMQVLDFDGQWPPSLERTLPFLVPEFYPSGWSHEVKSRIVRLLLPSM